MNQFAQIQNQKASIEPGLSLPPWKWFGEYKPNREPLWQWAKHFLAQCEPKTCGTLKVKQDNKPWRINLKNADLRDAYLRDTNLGDTYLRYAILWGADLQGAYLRNANLGNTNLELVDLRNAKHLTQEQINAACVYKSTILPANIIRPDKNPKDCPPELFQQQ